MSLLPAMRPRHAFVVPRPHDEVLDAVKGRLECGDCPCHATMAGNHLELLIDTEQRHFWSPWLSVDLLPDDDGTRVKCRYGPHPSVWTGFVSAYALLAFVALAGLVFGGTQVMLGHTPTGFMVLPVTFLLAGGLYIGTQVGQRLGAEQMHILDQFLESMLGVEPSR